MKNDMLMHFPPVSFVCGFALILHRKNLRNNKHCVYAFTVNEAGTKTSSEGKTFPLYWKYASSVKFQRGFANGEMTTGRIVSDIMANEVHPIPVIGESLVDN